MATLPGDSRFESNIKINKSNHRHATLAADSKPLGRPIPLSDRNTAFV